MKNVVFVIVLALAIAGAAFAQGTPEQAKNLVQAKQRIQQAKQIHQDKYRVLYAKSAFQQKGQGFCTKELRAKNIVMMKRMRGYRQQASAAMGSYPKCEALCHASRGGQCARMQAGDNRGKQAMIDKQMRQHCPLIEKVKTNCQ